MAASDCSPRHLDSRGPRVVTGTDGSRTISSSWPIMKATVPDAFLAGFASIGALKGKWFHTPKFSPCVRYAHLAQSEGLYLFSNYLLIMVSP